MIHAFKSARCRLALLAFLASTFVPTQSRAAMPDAASLLDYGFKGFTLGVECGLAVGYLSTGRTYDHGEWRQLVLGMGIGALAGTTLGIIISVADVTSRGVPVGYYVLRDSTYGTLIGAIVGALVGTLLWIDNGTQKDILRGASYGTLFGAVAGIAYGIVDGKNASPPSRRYGEWRMSLSPVGVGRDMGLAAQVGGRF